MRLHWPRLPSPKRNRVCRIRGNWRHTGKQQRREGDETPPSGHGVESSAQHSRKEQEHDDVQSQAARCTRKLPNNALTFPRTARLKLRLPMTKIITALLALAVFQSLASGQTSPTNPCTVPQQKQFEFWVGEWDSHLAWPETQ